MRNNCFSFIFCKKDVKALCERGWMICVWEEQRTKCLPTSQPARSVADSNEHNHYRPPAIATTFPVRMGWLQESDYINNGDSKLAEDKCYLCAGTDKTCHKQNVLWLILHVKCILSKHRKR